jgi:PilZ domain
VAGPVSQIVLPATSIAPSAFDGREVRFMSPLSKKSRPARRRTNQSAWMTIDGGFAARQCIVIDISEGGARLRVDDPQFVKPQFQLKFDRTSPGRACKVAWKKGDVIGIKFV